MGSEGSSPSGSAKGNKDMDMYWKISKKKKLRPWYASEKCPDCNKRLLLDGKKIYCQVCNKQWFSVESLKEEING